MFNRAASSYIERVHTYRLYLTIIISKARKVAHKITQDVLVEAEVVFNKVEAEDIRIARVAINTAEYRLFGKSTVVAWRFVRVPRHRPSPRRAVQHYSDDNDRFPIFRVADYVASTVCP